MTEPVGGKIKHFWVHGRLRPSLLLNTVLIKQEKKQNPALKIPKLPLSLAEHDHLPLGKSAVGSFEGDGDDICDLSVWPVTQGFYYNTWF